jgi:hypothetical protein
LVGKHYFQRNLVCLLIKTKQRTFSDNYFGNLIA